MKTPPRLCSRALRCCLVGAMTVARGAEAQSRGPVQRAGEAGNVTDTLRLYYVGYPVGRERYELVGDARALRLSADLDYIDRGRRTHLTAAMRTGRGYAPLELEITRLTDTSARRDTRIDVRGREATIVVRAETSHVALPAVAFAIAGYTPAAQHLLLLRYWLAHGRPATLAVVPGGPTNEVRIQQRGRDTLTLDGRTVVLDRYAVDGVVWGVETVWLDQAGRLAAFRTGGGGGLTFDAVRQELDPLYDRLMTISTRDRMSDLGRLSRRVHPIAAGTIALVGATLVDGTGRDPVPDATIVVARGRIAAAGPRATVAIPADAHIVDVRGKTIAPGLWDAHTHVMQIDWALVYLAAGVTTVRDMGNTLDFIVPLRATIDSARGGAIGPRLLLAGLVDGGGPNAFGAINATTPEEGRAAVRRYHALGFEQMKLYDLLKPDVVGAIAREAHALDMTVTGHLPRALTVVAAIDSGMDQLAHLPIRGDPASDSVHAVIDSLKAHGTVIDPTVSWGELGGHSTAVPVASFQPGVAYLPPVLAQRITKMGVPVDSAAARARLERTLRIIKSLHDAGVPVVDGTDEGVPGFSVYRDVELFAAAGFSPIEALQTATVVPARAMRIADDVGTLEPGKRADLIVLDANPLDDVRNIRTVRLVMKRGTLYRSADLWHAAGFRTPDALASTAASPATSR